MEYVINMLAKPKSIRTSQMASVVSVDSAMETYLKNSFVCLYSIKKHNPNIECILFLNFDLSEEWSKRFRDNSIRTEFVEFGNFKIREKYDWGIVQYRYDVMEWLVNNLSDNDSVIMLDTDVVCVGSLKDAFEEIKWRVLLFDVNHSKSIVDRNNIIINYLKIFPDETHCELIHWGGEFIGAKIIMLRQLFEACKFVILQAAQVSDLVNFNDEHITSIAVYRNWNKIPVNNANAYLYRYWTGLKFYLVSTNWYYNKVILWHVPAEKNAGILWLYKKIIKTRGMPAESRIAHRFGFPRASRTNVLPFIIANLHKLLK